MTYVYRVIGSFDAGSKIDWFLLVMMLYWLFWTVLFLFFT